MNSRNRPVIVTDEMIAALWRYMPSPYDIDTKDRIAAKRLIRAILRAGTTTQIP